MDTITDILARPGEAARQLTEMHAALAAVTARLAAVTEERNAAIELCDARVVDRDIQARRAERLLAERDNLWRICTAMGRRDTKRATAARKVAQWARKLRAVLEAINAHLPAARAALEAITAQLATVITERDVARAEVARMRLALEDAYTIGDVVKMRLHIAIALRSEPAPAHYSDEPCGNCAHGKAWHWANGKCQNACPCEEYMPAPTKPISSDDGVTWHTITKRPTTACTCRHIEDKDSNFWIRDGCPVHDRPAQAQPAAPECTCEHVMDGDDVAYTIRDRSCPVHAAPAAGRE